MLNNFYDKTDNLISCMSSRNIITNEVVTLTYENQSVYGENFILKITMYGISRGP